MSPLGDQEEHGLAGVLFLMAACLYLGYVICESKWSQKAEA